MMTTKSAAERSWGVALFALGCLLLALAVVIYALEEMGIQDGAYGDLVMMASVMLGGSITLGGLVLLCLSRVGPGRFWREDHLLDRTGRCRKCGYSLFGSETGVCPECGAVHRV